MPKGKVPKKNTCTSSAKSFTVAARVSASTAVVSLPHRPRRSVVVATSFQNFMNDGWRAGISVTWGKANSETTKKGRVSTPRRFRHWMPSAKMVAWATLTAYLALIYVIQQRE